MPLILVFLMGACELATLENKVFHRLTPESTSISSIILQFSSLMSLMKADLLYFLYVRCSTIRGGALGTPDLNIP